LTSKVKLIIIYIYLLINKLIIMNNSNKIKIYKFRWLWDCNNFCRIKDIITSWEFWCSPFNTLNDPMEWVYTATDASTKEIRKMFHLKMKYLICAFSGIKWFENPAIWGYYANWFKGVAIEIEIAKNKIIPIEYKNELIKNPQNVKDILTRKFKKWEPENEYRFIEKTDINNQKIWKITAIYFWDPYRNTNNEDDIIKNNKYIKEYRKLKEKIVGIANNNNIDCYNIEIEDWKVKENGKIKI